MGAPDVYFQHEINRLSVEVGRLRAVNAELLGVVNRLSSEFSPHAPDLRDGLTTEICPCCKRWGGRINHAPDCLWIAAQAALAHATQTTTHDTPAQQLPGVTQ